MVGIHAPIPQMVTAVADVKTPLLQSAFKGDTELDLSFCHEVTFIETIDLSGPRLILKFDDSLSILRNVMKIKIGDKLKCLLADPWHENVLNFTAQFTIMSAPVDGELVTLNCLQSEVADMKTAAATAKLFSKKNSSVAAIIQALAPGLNYDIGDFPLLNDYHLLPGERPSLVLRQLSLEHGALLYILRGKLCFKKLSDLYAQCSTSDKVFQYKNPNADYQIVNFSHINSDNLIGAVAAKKFMGFNFTHGPAVSSVGEGLPPELSSADTQAALNNLSAIAMPILDIITWGAGHLAPGTPIRFQWNMDVSYNDSFTDESLPKQAVIGNIAHYNAGAATYYCRLKAVVPA